MAKLNYSKELQNELVKLYTVEKKTMKEIQKQFGISHDKLKELLILNGVTSLKVKPLDFTKEQESLILKYYIEDLMGCKKIGELMKIPVRKIERFIKESGKTNEIGKTHKYKCKSNYFEEIDTPEKAYWLGVLFADGNIGSTRPTITFSAKEKDWVQQFLTAVESTNEPHREFHKVFNSEIWKGKISDDKMKQDLILHGCVPNKSLIIKFPELNKELIPHFIRGYFDGDGTVTFNTYINGSERRTLRSGFCSGSKEFLQELVKHLPVKTKHIRSNIRNNKGAGVVYTVMFSVKDSVKLYRYMYINATVWLKRKRNLFEYAIKQRRSETIIETPQIEVKE